MQQPTPLEQIRALYGRLSESDQASIMCDLIQGGHVDVRRSDDFIDALYDLDKAFDAAWSNLQVVIEGEVESDLTTQERASLSIYRAVAMEAA